MDQDRVLSSASKWLSNIHSVSENIFKGELQIYSKTAAIYYLDFNPINAEEFNTYQEKLLASTYYENSSSLQWNYYLLLFQDHIDSEFKKNIEGNDQYARKYVFTQNEFEDFFKIEEGNAETESNVISIWKEKLRLVDLQEVYNTEPYTRAIDRFLSNNTKKEVSYSANSSSTDDQKIKHVLRITLHNNYRCYPVAPRSFPFGNVNLITGVNGTGKTCLLEAIELILCGKSFRNPGIAEKKDSIDAIYNNHIVDNYVPTDNGKYRSRDLIWYGNSTYRSGNEAEKSFNRFNYFNADAAYSFANSNNEDEIKKALSDIVFGAEYSYLNERMNGFLTRLKPEYNRLLSNINEKKTKIIEAQNIINKNKESRNIDLLEKNIKDLVEKISFKQEPIDTTNYSQLEIKINVTLSIIESCRRLTSTTLLSTKENYTAKYVETSTTFKHVEELLLRVSILSKDLNILSVNLQNLNRRKALLDEALRYFDNEGFFRLDTVHKDLKRLAEQERKIGYTRTNLEKIDLKKYQDQTDDFNKLLGANQVRLLKLDSEKLAIQKQIKDDLEKLNENDKILEEIKRLGRKYIETFEVSDCPLCNVSFADQNELLRQIAFKKVGVFSDVSRDISKSNERIDEIDKEIAEINRLDNELTIINSSYIALFDSKPDNIATCITTIIDLNSQVNSIKIEKGKLQTITDFAISLGLSYERFLFLKSSLENEFDLKFDFIERKSFEDETAVITENVNRNDLQKSQKELELTNLLTAFGSNNNLDIKEMHELESYTQNLKQELEVLRQIINNIELIEKEISLDPSLDLSELETSLITLTKSIGSLKDEMARQVENEVAKKEIKVAQGFIDSNKNRLERLRVAVEVLESNLSKGQNESLETFFKKNISEIVDIFKTIHAPREFIDIVFSHGKLHLIPSDRVSRSVSQISTGQRSALALSIFISLNRKLKIGPQIIIFDDPIAFIDDLNALSFLDFLRDTLLKEGKQIFFATANKKFASLFEKKFSFLGDLSFKKWELKR